MLSRRAAGPLEHESSPAATVYHNAHSSCIAGFSSYHSLPTAQPRVAHGCDLDERWAGGYSVGAGPMQATSSVDVGIAATRDSSSIDGRTPATETETDGDKAPRPRFRSKEEKLARQKERQKVTDARAKEAASNPLHGFGLPDGDGGWPVSMFGLHPILRLRPKCPRTVVQGEVHSGICRCRQDLHQEGASIPLPSPCKSSPSEQRQAEQEQSRSIHERCDRVVVCGRWMRRGRRF